MKYFNVIEFKQQLINLNMISSGNGSENQPRIQVNEEV